MNTKTSITESRETWLAFRAEWRIRYKAASEDIRASKRALSTLHAERRLEADEAARGRIDGRVSSLQGTLAYERRDASGLMRELDAAKEAKAERMAELSAGNAIAA